MDNLTPRILDLVSQLSAREEPRITLERTYREALRRWWELMALGPEADRDEVTRVHQGILRLIDEVGEARTTRLRRQWAREWYRETGLCPHCGGRRPYHDRSMGSLWGGRSGRRSRRRGKSGPIAAFMVPTLLNGFVARGLSGFYASFTGFSRTPSPVISILTVSPG